MDNLYFIFLLVFFSSFVNITQIEVYVFFKWENKEQNLTNNILDNNSVSKYIVLVFIMELISALNNSKKFTQQKSVRYCILSIIIDHASKIL